MQICFRGTFFLSLSLIYRFIRIEYDDAAAATRYVFVRRYYILLQQLNKVRARETKGLGTKRHKNSTQRPREKTADFWQFPAGWANVKHKSGNKKQSLNKRSLVTY